MVYLIQIYDLFSCDFHRRRKKRREMTGGALLVFGGENYRGQESTGSNQNARAAASEKRREQLQAAEGGRDMCSKWRNVYIFISLTQIKLCELINLHRSAGSDLLSPALLLLLLTILFRRKSTQDLTGTDECVFSFLSVT